MSAWQYYQLGRMFGKRVQVVFTDTANGLLQRIAKHPDGLLVASWHLPGWKNHWNKDRRRKPPRACGQSARAQLELESGCNQVIPVASGFWVRSAGVRRYSPHIHCPYECCCSIANGSNLPLPQPASRRIYAPVCREFCFFRCALRLPFTTYIIPVSCARQGLP